MHHDLGRLDFSHLRLHRADRHAKELQRSVRDCCEHFEVQLLSGHLFLFFNRRRNCVKVLAWDRDGLMIWYKRLESGTFEISPLQNEGTSLEIDHVKLSMLLAGINIASAKRRKRFAAA